MSASSLTSILIWLPIGGAILIWLLPLSRYATGALAMLFSLAEVGFWIEQAARFDFSRSGLQMQERANWFGDLGVSYHIGVYGFSLWLVGLTVVGMAACTAYGFWVFLLSNVLWTVWGWSQHAYALIVLQFGLAVMNMRGVHRNDPDLTVTKSTLGSES